VENCHLCDWKNKDVPRGSCDCVMSELKILVGNVNSLFRGKSFKFGREIWEKYDIICLADCRINKGRFELLKKTFNYINTVNQFYVSLSEDIGPKHGALIYIN